MARLGYVIVTPSGRPIASDRLRSTRVTLVSAINALAMLALPLISATLYDDIGTLYRIVSYRLNSPVGRWSVIVESERGRLTKIEV